MYLLFARLKENREREASEQRRKRKEGVRISAKRRSLVSVQGPEPAGTTSGLESALHSFLSTVPDSLVRCRKNMKSPIQEAVSGAAPCISQGSPEKTPPQLQREDEQVALENQEEAEKMHEITEKVLRYQSSQSSLDDKVSGTPRRSERTQDTPATPHTPRPKSRDYFFANNGSVGSPWTILSPFTCSQIHTPRRNRLTHQHRFSSLSGGDDLDDGVWKRGEGDYVPNPSNRDSETSPSDGSAAVLECPSQRATLKFPNLRSVSMDETRRSPAPGFRLGDLFQKSTSQRSYSSGTKTENMREEGARSSAANKAGDPAEGQVSSFGFVSFFRRIGGRSKTGEVEQHDLGVSNT